MARPLNAIVRLKATLTVAGLWLVLGNFQTLEAQQAVVLYPENRVESFSFEELTPERLEQAMALWAWGPEMTPRRWADEDLAGLRASFTKLLDRGRLQIRLAGEHPARLEGVQPKPLRLLAAPAEMWDEVPEALLPQWSVPETGRLAIPRDPARPWRLRLVGHQQGSWWVEVPAGHQSVSLAPAAAEDHLVLLTDRAGKTLPGALTVFVVERGHERVLAQFRSQGPDTALQLPALPDLHEAVFLASSPDHVPRTLAVWPSALPPKLALSPGGLLRGRFVDAERRPVPGVEVRAEAWLESGVDFVARSAVSGEDGRFTLGSLPRTQVALAAAKAGFAEYRVRQRLEGPSFDLGDLELAASHQILLRVVDDREEPIAGATVARTGGSSAVTDRQGQVRLDVPKASQLLVAAQAPGHLPVERRLSPPFREAPVLTLQRAFQVVGSFIDATGAGVEDGSVRVGIANSYSNKPLLPGGRFELDLPPGKSCELTFRSSLTLEVRLTLPAGEAGERRDLGEVRAEAGLAVRGRLVRHDDGTAVANARVWTPRPSEEGDVVAWVQGDFLAATSDHEGVFVLQGLPHQPLLLRIDAPELARGHLQVAPPAEGRVVEGSVVELGDVALVTGADVRVFVERPASSEADSGPAIARVDLRGQWLDLDVLTATVVDGEALLRRVPPGSATVSVLEGRNLLCERVVAVAFEDQEVEVDCRREELTVLGWVLRGDRPAGPGRLAWLPAAGTVPAIILNTATPLGAGRQKVFGGGRPQVDVEVGADGSFLTTELSPGTWQVVFVPDSGAGGAPQFIELAPAAHQEIELRFPPNGVEGVVVDVEGVPVAGARVEEVTSRAFVVSDAAGRFELSGLEPGAHRLLARLGERRSELTDIVLDSVRPPEAVVLQLSDHVEDRLEVTVLEQDLPVPGCLLFVEGEDGSHRLATTGWLGNAEIELLPPLPTYLRVAAFKDGRWAFRGWTELGEVIEDGLVMSLDATGTLELSAEQSAGTPEILTPEGWNLTPLLRRAGILPTLQPGHPQMLPGLPAGTYNLAIGNFHGTVTVRAGEVTAVELP